MSLKVSPNLPQLGETVVDLYSALARTFPSRITRSGCLGCGEWQLLGRTSATVHLGGNDWSRRNLIVPTWSGEGPLAILIADLRRRAEFTIAPGR